jgi:hypothetical protein
LLSNASLASSQDFANLRETSVPPATTKGVLLLQAGAVFTTARHFTNTGAVTLSAGGTTPSLLNVGGDLTNAGTVSLKAGAATSSLPKGVVVDVAGDLNNSGTFSLSSSQSGTTPLSASGRLSVAHGVINIGTMSFQGKDGVVEFVGIVSNQFQSNSQPGKFSILDGSSLVAQNSFTNSGSLVVSTTIGKDGNSTLVTQATVQDAFTNSGNVSISALAQGTSATTNSQAILSVESLSNLGTLSLTATTSRAGQSAFAILNVTDSFQQLQGATLTGGTIKVSAAGTGAGAVAEFRMPGAINTIGAGAAISLAGTSATIRNTLDQSDALAGLVEVDGSLNLANRAFIPAGDFKVGSTGTLALASGGNLQMTADRILQEDGKLDLAAGATLSALHVTFGETANLNFSIAFTNGGHTLNTGVLNVMNLSLGGVLTLSLTSLPTVTPLETDQFVLFSADAMTGTFGNVNGGGWVDVTYNNAVKGRFLLTYGANQALLSNYQAVPEPGTVELCIAAIASFAFGYGRKTRRKFRP